MIIKSFELEKLKSSKFKLHLIYGNNEGVKQDIINNVYLKEFDGELLKYDEQEILNNQDNFLSSLLTNSLFSNSKLIVISRATDKLNNIICDILEREKVEAKINLPVDSQI